jgi:hypothetical protein
MENVDKYSHHQPHPNSHPSPTTERIHAKIISHISALKVLFKSRPIVSWISWHRMMSVLLIHRSSLLDGVLWHANSRVFHTYKGKNVAKAEDVRTSTPKQTDAML